MSCILYCFICSDPIIPEDVQNVTESSDEEMVASTSGNSTQEITTKVTRLRATVGQQALSNIKSAQKRQKRNYDKHLVQQQVTINQNKC
jgi:hypothetical protein